MACMQSTLLVMPYMMRKFNDLRARAGLHTQVRALHLEITKSLVATAGYGCRVPPWLARYLSAEEDARDALEAGLLHAPALNVHVYRHQLSSEGQHDAHAHCGSHAQSRSGVASGAEEDARRAASFAFTR